MIPQGQRRGERISAVVTGVCIAAALVFAPLAFGAHEPWAFSLLAVLGYTALAAAVARALLEQDARAFATPMLVPMVLGLCLVAVQLARWPSDVVALVTPRTVAAYADASASVGGRGSGTSTSLNRSAHAWGGSHGSCGPPIPTNTAKGRSSS